MRDMNESNNSFRTFLALPLTPSVIEELQRLQQLLKRQITSPAVKWVRPDQTHLTLRFFGNVPADQIPALVLSIRKVCQGQKAFRLSAQKLGCFPGLNFPKVIWMGLTGDVGLVSELQARLLPATKAWGDHQEEREFHPHLTLARVKASPGEARQIGENLRGITSDVSSPWIADRLELMRSQLTPQGPIYSVLATVSLDPLGSTSLDRT
jgi:RNA 2',3'-cyclic 3'-phosphodiesterase